MSTSHVRTRAHRRVEVKKVMSRRQQAQYGLIVVLWSLVNWYYWTWWLQPGHVSSAILFVPLSLAMLYVFTILPSMYLFFLGRMRQPVPLDPESAERAGAIGRVAVISLTVPGAESIEIVRRQLSAMKAIRYPHDSWILVDKEHSPEIAGLATDLGVGYFSRHDADTWGAAQVAAWNQPTAPFAAKTKAGNVNSWLDAFGERYSHFTQLDIDHNPKPSYLDRVLGYFVDRDVAYVQAPSVYHNFEHWTARGSSEQELVLQGPLQMGFFGFSRTPFIIGSHCTYDVAAIQRIGGFQPTRAEDHLDTVCLAAKGYEGVYLPEIIAVGDGPEDFRTYLAQQFAWAYSMIQVLFTYTPRLLGDYTLRRGVQFLFVQTWYTFWSLSMLTMFVAPLVTLVLDEPIADVGYWTFLAHVLPVSVVSTITWLWSRRWQLPARLRLSWRGVLLHVARWVVVLSAFVQVLLRVRKPYMITVKGMGAGSVPRFPLTVVAPYIAFIVVSLGVCWFYLDVYGRGPSGGYLFFALKGALLFWLMLVVLLGRDLYGLVASRVSLSRIVRARTAPFLVVGALTGLLVVVTTWSTGPVLEALTVDLPFRLGS